MRGWLFLRGLARDHRVTLVAGSPGFPYDSEADAVAVGEFVEETILLRFHAWRDPVLLARCLASALGAKPDPVWDWVEPTPAMRRQLEPLRRKSFDRIHVFRLYMLPLALAVQEGGSKIPIQLDLDDWESQTRLAMADLAA